MQRSATIKSAGSGAGGSITAHCRHLLFHYSEPLQIFGNFSPTESQKAVIWRTVVPIPTTFGPLLQLREVLFVIPDHLADVAYEDHFGVAAIDREEEAALSVVHEGVSELKNER
jgi:hypothetical protein